MKDDVKKLWVSALRSGKYKQGTGVLYDKNRDTYCCLGVLREIHKEVTGENTTSYCGRNQYPQVTVCEWAGIPAPGSGKTERLAEMNDFDDTFDKIADYIEEYL